MVLVLLLLLFFFSLLLLTQSLLFCSLLPCCFHHPAVLGILELLQVIERHRYLHSLSIHKLCRYIAVYCNHCRAVTVVSKYLIGVLVPLLIGYGKLTADINLAVYDSCHLTDSLLLGFVHRLCLVFVSRYFLVK